MIIQKPITPEWGDAGSKILEDGTANRISSETNDDHDPEFLENFHLIFTGVFTIFS